MEEDKKKSNRKTYRIISIIALICSLVSLSIVYAHYTVNIIPYENGNYIDAKWSIVWDNVKEPIVKGTAEKGKMTIIYGNQTITGQIGSLKRPGDSITQIWDAHNKGNIDAEIIGIYIPKITCKSNNQNDADMMCKNLKLSITYDNIDFNEGLIGSRLNKGESKTIKMTLTYNENTTFIPKNEVNVYVNQLNMISYIQAK